MKWMNRLFRYPLPYDTEGSNELFLRAVRENCRYQYLHNAKYRAILDGKGFHPSMLRTYDDIAALPVIPTLVFKHHAMYTLSPRRMPVKATSSGTGGAFSRVGFAWGDLRRGLSMVLRVVGYRRLFSLRPANYIVFGYKRHRSNHTAVTKTAFGATLFTPQLHRTYALRYTDGRYVPDLEGVIRAILRFSRSRFPLRFMGFPSYTYFAMRMLDERGISLRLPKGSKIMLGGGWKQFYREAVDKSAFYALAKKVFNIDDCNIVEFFGAVEHPILYCDCPRHHFHVPVYGRVIIRDVNTLAPLPYGHMGLVNLVSPMVMATPILSVMTDDLGVLRDGRECGCGLTSPYLEIIGRVGLKDIKTCAAGAADILKETGGSV